MWWLINYHHERVSQFTKIINTSFHADRSVANLHLKDVSTFCHPKGGAQMCRKAKFVGSPLVVGKMIATHFWKPSKGHHFLTLRLRVALNPQTFAVRIGWRTPIFYHIEDVNQTRQATFRRRYACSMSSNAPWLTKSSVLRQPKRGRQLFGKRADGKICVKKRRPFHEVKVRTHPF